MGEGREYSSNPYLFLSFTRSRVYFKEELHCRSKACSICVIYGVRVCLGGAWRFWKGEGRGKSGRINLATGESETASDTRG